MSYVDQLDLIFGPISEGKILDEVLELYKSLHEYLGFSIERKKSGIAAAPATGSFVKSSNLTTEQLTAKWSKEGWKPLAPISKTVNSVSTHGSSMGSFVGTIKDIKAVWGIVLPIKGQPSFHSSLVSKLEGALADTNLGMTAEEALDLYKKEYLPNVDDIIIALFQRSFGRVDVATQKVIADLEALKAIKARPQMPTIYDLIGQNPPHDPPDVGSIDEFIKSQGVPRAQSTLRDIVDDVFTIIQRLKELQSSDRPKDQQQFRSLARKAEDEFGTDIWKIINNTEELGDKYAEAEMQLAESVIKYW